MELNLVIAADDAPNAYTIFRRIDSAISQISADSDIGACVINVAYGGTDWSSNAIRRLCDARGWNKSHYKANPWYGADAEKIRNDEMIIAQQPTEDSVSYAVVFWNKTQNDAYDIMMKSARAGYGVIVYEVAGDSVSDNVLISLSSNDYENDGRELAQTRFYSAVQAGLDSASTII